MNKPQARKDIDVAILCGGLGKRLRSVVSDRPKPMAEVNGSPFLDILIDYVASYGFKRFILCTGYQGRLVKQYYQNRGGELTIVISEEKEPLGTGGAIKNAESFIQSEIFLVLNGDSFCELSINDFLNFHASKGAVVSIAVTPIERPLDSGVVRLDEDQKIISFEEKAPVNRTALVNAGVYLFDRTILKYMPSGKKFSLEHDFFPRILDKKIYGYITNERLFDIGTPERLELARQHFGYLPKEGLAFRQRGKG